MKKLLCALMSVAVVLSFAACSEEKAPAAVDSAVESAADSAVESAVDSAVESAADSAAE